MKAYHFHLSSTLTSNPKATSSSKPALNAILSELIFVFTFTSIERTIVTVRPMPIPFLNLSEVMIEGTTLGKPSKVSIALPPAPTALFSDVMPLFLRLLISESDKPCSFNCS